MEISLRLLHLLCGALHLLLLLFFISINATPASAAEDTTPFTGALDKLGIGSGKYRKFAGLIADLPPPMKKAFMEQDFSHTSERDIRSLNTTICEFMPTKVLAKMNATLLTPIIEKMLAANLPHAMGKILSSNDKLEGNWLLDKLRDAGGTRYENEEAAGVLLYSAINKLGDKGGITSATIRRLSNDDLLRLVPEEMLMRVRDSKSATYLLTMYVKPGAFPNLEDKAIVYKLVEKGYGEAEEWTMQTLLAVTPQFLAMMPSDFMRRINTAVISEAMGKWRYLKFRMPIQPKRITDAFMMHSDLTAEEIRDSPNKFRELGSALNNLGDLACFVNPSITSDQTFLNNIVNSCNNLNLPSPMSAIRKVLNKRQETSRKRMNHFRYEDIKELGTAVIKNGPPELAGIAMKVNALSDRDLKDIGGAPRAIGSQQEEFDNSRNAFLRGIVAQTSNYAIRQFTKWGGVDFPNLPSAFLSGVGIKAMLRMDNRNLEDMIEKLRSNPDTFDDSEKGILLKRLKEEGMLDSTDLPAEVRTLLPRRRGRESISPKNILEGLPSDSELRLQYAGLFKRRISYNDLRTSPYLIGTLSPKQVSELGLSEIPGVLWLIRKSEDGPPLPTLEALYRRYAEYIREKSDDKESDEDKKLLKHITAAEISRLPATVLAYFIGTRSDKLPADVRKEIMVSLGELSIKDHAMIPSRTREEIINLGLDALDEILERDNKLDVTELASIGAAVVDLPADKIKKLTPVAVEQSIGFVQGTMNFRNNKFRQRACLKPDQKKAWKKKIFEIYDKPERWDGAIVLTVCCSLGLLTESELRSIPQDSLANCRCVSDEKPPSHLAELKKSLDINCKHELGRNEDKSEETLKKVKAEIGLDLDNFEQQLIPGHPPPHPSAGKNLTCFALRIAGTATHFTKEQIDTMNDHEISNCLYELGMDPLGYDKSRILWKKLTKVHGGVEKIPTDALKFAGFILTGITQGDVSKLNMSDPDIRAAFARPLGLSKNVLEKMSSQLESQLNKPLSRFDAGDLITMGNIICGFPPERIQDIKSDAFNEALPILRNLHSSCERTRLAALSAICLRRDVLGDPKNWNSADVRAIGTLLNGLSPTSVESIPPESFIGLTPTVAEALPNAILSVITPEQIKQVSHFSAQALSSDQLGYLKSETRDSIERVKRGPSITDAVAPNHIPLRITIITIVFTALFAQLL